MPEGPEIRLAAEKVAAAVRGRRVEAVRFGQPALRRHERRLTGRRVEEVEPRGKALLLHFEGGSSIYTHNQLYGRWFVVKAGRMPKTARSLRLAIETRERWALLYSASDIAVMPRAQLARHPYLRRLGVELLAPQAELPRVRLQLDEPRFQGRSLAALLLDQGFLAGIGNYLRSEILFVAGLRGEVKLGQLDAASKDRLADAALALTRQAYRTRGVTNDLERAARLEAKGLPFSAYRHHVFGREGEACWSCGGLIGRRRLAGRALFECRRCQVAV